MSAWLDLVKKVSKSNPGKTLKKILPIASAQWKKIKRANTNKTRGTKRRYSYKRRRSSKK